MLERLMAAAERTASGVSRRAFFGQMGRLAAAAAAVAAGITGTATAQQQAMCGPQTTWGACIGKPVGSICQRYGGVKYCRSNPAGTACSCAR